MRRIQASPLTTDAERTLLGITVPDLHRSPGGAGTETESRPIGIVDTSQRLRHTIAFHDSATPTKRGKPAGVMGCEIWCKVGDPIPTDPAECQFIALDTASPYVADYTGADAGKKAHYLLRWAHTNGEKGPWSETVSATIGG